MNKSDETAIRSLLVALNTCKSLVWCFILQTISLICQHTHSLLKLLLQRELPFKYNLNMTSTSSIGR